MLGTFLEVCMYYIYSFLTFTVTLCRIYHYYLHISEEENKTKGGKGAYLRTQSY